ncbi:MAG TPA: TadE/TadG family type IV pilus assembly protein [Bryobacteraceae bacterium]|nr:TadE/TadG family type IV pilus assembly protein [Bryobacteraceae bacterium]
MRSGRTGRKGHSILELTLFLPWVLFLFVGAFDWGFYSWALISTQNAARVAAMYTSSNIGTSTDSAGACKYAAAQLAYAPNVAGNPAINSPTGVGTGSNTCTAAPITVTATSVTGPDGSTASQVSVTYQTPVLIPIPGALTGQISITRTVEMRVRS